MGTFYVKTDYPAFSEAMVSYLLKKGYTESTKLPVDFIFVSGNPAYYRNKFDTNRSQWVSLLYGHSVDILTNKVNLHKKIWR